MDKHNVKMLLRTAMTNTITHYGSFMGFNKVGMTAIEEFFLFSKDDFKTIKPGSIYTPSPWHAAFWLINYVVASPRFKKGRFLFRGQNNPEWQLVPSLMRSNQIEIDRIRTDFLLSILKKQAASDWGKLSDDILEVTAQHYGLKTMFLDFTFNPLTAIAFASQYSKSNRVAVHLIQFWPAVTSGLRILLPPPWVERLYKQSGLALSFKDIAKTTQMERLTLTMLFENDPDFLEESYVPKFKDLFPEESWIVKAVRWINERKPIDREKFDEMEKSITDALGPCDFPMFYAMHPYSLRKQLDALIEYTTQLSTLINEEGDIYLDDDVLAIIARDNYSYIKQLLSTFDIIYNMLNNPNYSDWGNGPIFEKETFKQIEIIFRRYKVVQEQLAEGKYNIKKDFGNDFF